MLAYAKTLEDAESQAEEIEKMSQDVEDLNLTRKSKKQNKTDERAKDIDTSYYFKRKSSHDATQKACFRSGGSYPHMAQCVIGKTVIMTAIGKTTSKDVAKKRISRIQVMGESFNHLNAFFSISKSESDSDHEVFKKQALLLQVSHNQKVVLENNDTKGSLVQKTINDEFLLRKVTLTSLFLTTVLQD